jgi:hypoxanthine-DNA glycosylase
MPTHGSPQQSSRTSPPETGETPVVTGFAPLIGPGARVLILGNAPSELSLARHQYYGNPRNAFWRITGEVFGFDPLAPYEQRTEGLLAHGVAVWDFLRSCRRAGSLDSAIERTSMRANAFDALFDAHPTIGRILFNGAAAEQNFGRLVGVPPLPHERLPSTSPAQTMRYEQKLAFWRTALTAAPG